LRHAVINLDDPMGLRLVAHLRRSRPSLHLTGYTLVAATAAAQHAALGPHGLCLHASELRGSHAGTQFQLQMTPATGTGTGGTLVRSQLVGDFNVSNLLGVLGVLLARGLAPADAIAALEALQPVPGRMQQLGAADQPLVVIDYAHTPDALEKTLASLRQLAQARDGALWCVFGCGGDRDPGKRAQMGAAAQAADHVIVTSDNPRSEQPGAIIADIVTGFAAATPPQVIEDRATAILWSLRHAARADVILLAGKGHESYQEINGRKLPFRDADHAALALAARATMKGLA
jgi:UDP-N-acetylmuramoyl-L-alanyl-D-glutamate--2,6-diaminopimelate ligase